MTHDPDPLSDEWQAEIARRIAAVEAGAPLLSGDAVKRRRTRTCRRGSEARGETSSGT